MFVAVVVDFLGLAFFFFFEESLLRVGGDFFADFLSGLRISPEASMKGIEEGSMSRLYARKSSRNVALPYLRMRNSVIFTEYHSARSGSVGRSNSRVSNSHSLSPLKMVCNRLLYVGNFPHVVSNSLGKS